MFQVKVVYLMSQIDNESAFSVEKCRGKTIVLLLDMLSYTVVVGQLHLRVSTTGVLPSLVT